MSTGLHKDLAVAEIHPTVSLEYANTAARTGDTSLTTADKGRIARQTDNDTYWLLQDETPTWIQITASMALHALGGLSHSADTLANLNSKISDATLIDTGDSRLSDARTPTAHNTSHQSGGSDAIKLDDLAAPDDNTDLDASTSKHGLLKKLGGGTTDFLRADGAWAAPTFGASYQTAISTAESSTTSSTFQDKATLTTPTLPAGTYRVGWRCLRNNADKPGETRLYNATDAALLGGLHQLRMPNSPTNYWVASGFAEVVFATSGSKTFKIQWRDVDGGNAQYVKDARIEIWRVA